MKSCVSTIKQFLCLSFVALSLHAHAQVDTTPRIGVLLPQIASHGKQEMQQKMQQELDKVPAKMRAQMEQMITKTSENVGVVQRSMQQRLPYVVQQLWIDSLAQKGLAAIAIDADTIDSATKKVGDKNVRWFLQSSVRTDNRRSQKQQAMDRGLTITTSVSLVTLKVISQLVEATGSIISPSTESSYSGDMDETGSGPDLWVQAGNHIAAVTVETLPPGRTASPELGGELPPQPDVTSGVRFEIQTSDSYVYKGKSRIAGGNSDKNILEMAGDMIAYQDARKHGFLYAGSTGQIYVTDDVNRSYYKLTPSDWAFTSSISGQISSLASGQRQTQAKESLMITGKDGNITRYRYSGEGSDVSSVDIEFGESLPAWQSGMKSIKALQASANGQPVVMFGSDPVLAYLLWEELIASPLPARRIAIKNGNSLTEVRFELGPPPRAVDFAIPSTYVSHSNPILMYATALE